MKKVLAVTVALFLAASAQADIVATGDVEPGDPSTWTVASDGRIGDPGVGTLEINGGSDVENYVGSIGRATGSDGTVTVTGAGSTWTNANNLYVGRAGTGALAIQNSGSVSNVDGYIGYYSGIAGSATVTGAGSQWTNSGSLGIGWNGSGTLNVTAGGAVSNSIGYIARQTGSSGTVTIDGLGSTWTNSGELYVGSIGTGILNIQNSGAVSNTTGYIGFYADGDGAVTVTGDGSSWTNSSALGVGYAGTGVLTISAGGAVSNGTGSIGWDTGSGTVTVDGTDSTWTNTSYLYVGREGTGVLNVTDGGSVTNTNGYLGYYADAEGTATVTGAGSTWTNSGYLGVGWNGSGTLSIANGGAVSNTSGYVGGVNGSTGTATATVTGDGSTWTNSGYLYVGRDGGASLTVAAGGTVTSMAGSIATEIGTTGTVTVTGADSTWTMSDLIHVGCGMTDGQLVTRGAGTLNISDGGEVIAPYGIIGSTSTLSGDGTLTLDDGSGTLGNYGTIAPGNSIGTLTVDGNVDFRDGSTLEAEIDNAGNCDLLDVTGNVTINDGTTLAVNSNGETIQDGQQYTLIEAGGAVTGEFSTLDTSLVTWDTSVESDVIYGGSTVVLISSVEPFDTPVLLRTDNQRAVGRAIEQIDDASGYLGGIVPALQGIGEDDNLRHAYDQLSGQTRPSIAPILNAHVSRFTGAVSGRMQSTHMASLGMEGPMLAMAGNPSDVARVGNTGWYDGDSRYGFWTKGLGAIADRDEEEGVNGYDYRTGGAALGVDYRFTENLMGGVTFGYSDTDVEYRQSRDNSEIESLYAGFYGSYQDFDGYIDAVVAYTDFDSDTERYVDLVSERIRGDFDGYECSASIEAARNYYFKELLIQPLCGFEFGYQRQDSYTENGGESALRYGSQTFESYKSALGAKASKYLYSAGEQRLWAQLRAKWLHEFGDATAGMTASFASTPGYSFTIRDAELNRDSAVLGTGLKYEANKDIVLFADYDALLNGDLVAHAFSGGIRFTW